MNIRKKIGSLFAGVTLLLLNVQAWADFATQSFGANGYDVVAYHTQNKPVQGSRDFYSFINGVTYLFASEGNKKLFDANPEQYLPAYGGYCAMAMTLGKKHLTNPEAFLVYKGKLYLNKADARPRWLKDVPGNIEKADKVWKEIKDIDPAKLQ
ncbi:YHS domain [Legionella cherrii]|uniref:YHS domain n=2 Tax=Legionella cherrii TaxID=28084 RepID=A0A0W0SCJ4_9GAMM|nr:YHS domain protein [Legionella cherrii]VEB33641.1 YHS domain [Legionella cherrii]